MFQPHYNSHLSTTAIFVSADSPYIDSCSSLCTTATSLQWPNGRTVHTFTLVTASLQRPPLYNGHFCFGGQSIRSLLFQPHYNGHLSTTAIFVSADSPYVHSCSSLTTTATSLQRPFLFRRTVHKKDGKKKTIDFRLIEHLSFLNVIPACFTA